MNVSRLDQIAAREEVWVSGKSRMLVLEWIHVDGRCAFRSKPRPVPFLQVILGMPRDGILCKHLNIKVSFNNSDAV